MPITDGIQVAQAIRDLRLPVRMVLLTAHKDEALVNKALDSGLHGYVVKDAAVSEIVECVRQVHGGQNYVSPQLSSILLKRRSRTAELAAATPGLDALSPTERRVLALVAQGKTSREIGEALFISPRTVESHRANIGEKLDLRGTNALITFAVANRSQLS
jgi:DNA-binding NarL/FixJ family response regulator